MVMLHVMRSEGPHVVGGGRHGRRPAHRVGELLRHLRQGRDGVEGGGGGSERSGGSLVGVDGDVVRPPAKTARTREPARETRTVRTP